MYHELANQQEIGESRERSRVLSALREILNTRHGLDALAEIEVLVERGLHAGYQDC